MNIPPFSSFRNDVMQTVVQELDRDLFPTLLEIGRTRDLLGAEGDGWSTIHCARYAQEREGHLISIDKDPETEATCRDILGRVLGIGTERVTFINGDALSIPLSVIGKVQLLSLDGLDCDGGWEQRSADWHLVAFDRFESLLAPGGLLLIDDCMETEVPRGKGLRVIPRAFSLGYQSIECGYMHLWRKPS